MVGQVLRSLPAATRMTGTMLAMAMPATQMML